MQMHMRVLVGGWVGGWACVAPQRAPTRKHSAAHDHVSALTLLTVRTRQQADGCLADKRKLQTI
jgi:hypothetical protein